MAADAAFLTYYLNEIDHLRLAGTEFSRTHKHLAGSLDFQDSATDDPQVARLIESFAFLTARLQQRFDAEFPQIPTALLEALYPQLVSPIPSMAIADFRVAPKQDRAAEGITVPPDTALYALTANGDECRFRTTAPLPLWPIEVVDVAMPPPSGFRQLDTRHDVQACVRVRLRCMGETRNFRQLTPASLRFYVDGDRDGRFRLFELLCNNVVDIAILRDDDADATLEDAPALHLAPVGLDPDHAMLPYPEAAHHGYRLLQEYFNYPDKLMFVELTGLAPGQLGPDREVDLLILLDVEPVAPLRLDPGSLRLGCVPIINLFYKTSEPIRLDHMSVDYPLEPDIRSAGSTEIHTVLGISRSAKPPPPEILRRAGIDRAVASDAAVANADRTDAIPPYFSPIPDSATAGTLRWLARRLPAANPMLGGTDVQLSFVDPNLDPQVPAEDVLFAQLLCTNRALARQITTMTAFRVETDLPVDRIHCIAKPTMPADPPMTGESLWRLVSHLSLNMLSLCGGRDGLEALKQVLFLYSGTDETSRKRRQIEGITALSTRQVVRRLGRDHWRGFVRGTEISIRFRDGNFVGGSAYLFGSVLDRFFALYAGVNSFTQVVIRREHDDEEWKRWPARVGDRPLL